MPAHITLEPVETSAGRVDAESSMLTPQEMVFAKEAHKRVYDRYHAIFQQKGGTDSILKELQDYLVEKCADPLSANPEDPSHRQGLDTIRTALRALLDPELARTKTERGAGYESLFHPGATEDTFGIPETEGVPPMSYREFLAYRWLAASDPDMPITKANLKTIPQNISIAEKRKILIESEKANCIGTIAEVRRAHNGDTGHYPKDSLIDEPSCAPGTFGRLVLSPVFNNIARMEINPLKLFPLNVEASIVEKFKNSGPDVINGYNFLIEKNFLFTEPEEDVHYERCVNAYLEFSKSITPLKENMIITLKDDLQMESEDGTIKDEFTPERKVYAEKTLDEIIDSLNISDPATNIKETLVEKMNAVVEENKKNEIRKLIMLSAEKEYNTAFNKIGDELQEVINDLKKIDIKNLDNKSIITFQEDFIKRKRDIINKKIDLKNSILLQSKNAYQNSLIQEGIQPSAQEIDAFNFKSSKSIRADKENFNKINQACEELLSETASKRSMELSERVDGSIKKFLIENKDDILKRSSELKWDMTRIKLEINQSVDHINKKLTVPHLHDHEKKAQDLKENVKDLRVSISEKFSEFCKKENLELSFEDLDELNKNLFEAEFKTSELLNDLKDIDNDLEEAKKIHVVHDQYQQFLHKAAHETLKIAVKLSHEINREILDLEDMRPSKKSLGHKQLEVLQTARQALKVHIEKFTDPKESSIDEIMKKEEEINKIVHSMSSKLNEIGYSERGKFKNTLKKIEHHIVAIINWTFKLNIKVKEGIKQHKVEKILRFLTTPEMEKIKKERELIKNPHDTPHHHHHHKQ